MRAGWTQYLSLEERNEADPMWAGSCSIDLERHLATEGWYGPEGNLRGAGASACAGRHLLWGGEWKSTGKYGKRARRRELRCGRRPPFLEQIRCAVVHGRLSAAR